MVGRVAGLCKESPKRIKTVLLQLGTAWSNGSMRLPSGKTRLPDANSANSRDGASLAATGPKAPPAAQAAANGVAWRLWAGICVRSGMEIGAHAQSDNEVLLAAA